MSRQNFSMARVETRTRESIGKYERHNERKNEHYGNRNVDLSRTPYPEALKAAPKKVKDFIDGILKSIRKAAPEQEKTFSINCPKRE